MSKPHVINALCDHQVRRAHGGVDSASAAYDLSRLHERNLYARLNAVRDSPRLATVKAVENSLICGRLSSFSGILVKGAMRAGCLLISETSCEQQNDFSTAA
jgi:hypothetical protein